MKQTHYALQNLPARILLLSDFHNHPTDPVSTLCQGRRVDLICITGDMFYSTHPLTEQENVLPFLSSCVAIAPTIVSWGNHEQAISKEEIKTIEGIGAVVLDNEWREVVMNGRKIIVGGLSSGYYTAYQWWREKNPGREKPEHGEVMDHSPDISWLSDFAAVPGYHILLSHHPEYYPLVPRKVELILCGHTHGGQWRIFGRGLYAPGQGVLPRWSKGVYEGRMVVSAGMSNTAKVPRVFNPTEIVVVEPA